MDDSPVLEGVPIGRGSFGDVRLIKGNPDVAAKYILKNSLAKILTFNRERNTLQELNHPNIVRYYGFEENNWYNVIRMEYCERRSLDGVLKDSNIVYSMETVFRWAKDLFAALTLLAEISIVHRDIKPRKQEAFIKMMLSKSFGQNSVLVTNYFTLKLGDFGSVRDLKMASSATATFAGTYQYMSPEAFGPPYCNRREINSLNDVYSVGLVLWEIVERRVVYSRFYNDHGFNYQKLFYDLLLKKGKLYRLEEIDCVEEDLKALVARCTSVQMDLRGNAKDCYDGLQEKNKQYKDEKFEPLISEAQAVLIRPIGFDGTTKWIPVSEAYLKSKNDNGEAETSLYHIESPNTNFEPSTSKIKTTENTGRRIEEMAEEKPWPNSGSLDIPDAILESAKNRRSNKVEKSLPNSDRRKNKELLHILSLLDNGSDRFEMESHGRTNRKVFVYLFGSMTSGILFLALFYYYSIDHSQSGNLSELDANFTDLLFEEHCKPRKGNESENFLDIGNIDFDCIRNKVESGKEIGQNGLADCMRKNGTFSLSLIELEVIPYKFSKNEKFELRNYPNSKSEKIKALKTLHAAGVIIEKAVFMAISSDSITQFIMALKTKILSIIDKLDELACLSDSDFMEVRKVMYELDYGLVVTNEILIGTNNLRALYNSTTKKSFKTFKDWCERHPPTELLHFLNIRLPSFSSELIKSTRHNRKQFNNVYNVFLQQIHFLEILTANCLAFLHVNEVTFSFERFADAETVSSREIYQSWIELDSYWPEPVQVLARAEIDDGGNNAQIAKRIYGKLVEKYSTKFFVAVFDRATSLKNYYLKDFTKRIAEAEHRDTNFVIFRSDCDKLSMPDEIKEIVKINNATDTQELIDILRRQVDHISRMIFVVKYDSHLEMSYDNCTVLQGDTRDSNNKTEHNYILGLD